MACKAVMVVLVIAAMVVMANGLKTTLTWWSKDCPNIDSKFAHFIKLNANSGKCLCVSFPHGIVGYSIDRGHVSLYFYDQPSCRGKAKDHADYTSAQSYCYHNSYKAVHFCNSLPKY